MTAREDTETDTVQLRHAQDSGAAANVAKRDGQSGDVALDGDAIEGLRAPAAAANS